MAAVADETKGWSTERRARTTVGLLQTVCRQCSTAPQSAAVFTFWHHTAEPLVHSFRPRTGLAAAKRKTIVRGWLISRTRSTSLVYQGSGLALAFSWTLIWPLTQLYEMQTTEAPHPDKKLRD